MMIHVETITLSKGGETVPESKAELEEQPPFIPFILDILLTLLIIIIVRW